MLRTTFWRNQGRPRDYQRGIDATEGVVQAVGGSVLARVGMGVAPLAVPLGLVVGIGYLASKLLDDLRN